jgi:hypothetical protein
MIRKKGKNSNLSPVSTARIWRGQKKKIKSKTNKRKVVRAKLITFIKK